MLKIIVKKIGAVSILQPGSDSKNLVKSDVKPDAAKQLQLFTTDAKLYFVSISLKKYV